MSWYLYLRKHIDSTVVFSPTPRPVDYKELLPRYIPLKCIKISNKTWGEESAEFLLMTFFFCLFSTFSFLVSWWRSCAEWRDRKKINNDRFSIQDPCAYWLFYASFSKHIPFVFFVFSCLAPRCCPWPLGFNVCLVLPTGELCLDGNITSIHSLIRILR